MNDLIQVSTHGAVAALQLNCLPTNAIAREMMDQLIHACARIAADKSICAVIVWGGPMQFAGGSDLKQMRQLSLDCAFERSRSGQAAFSSIAQIDKPVVAAIAGMAIGGGLELTLWADYRIATESAVMGLPEVTHGRMPGAGGTQRLPRLIGMSRALDLIFSGRLIHADEAKYLGLVNEVVPDDMLFSAALAWAEQFTALSPLAVSTARRAVEASSLPLEEGLAVESRLYADLYVSDASSAQLTAFHMQNPST
ncbi:enoyl-CoA hydratase/isomerase family protein [Paraburkholderia sp.]|uniref:enoyl-CoA hydratase/isomerase family protein n=1 Tax=Paraburkholderia sp. TaxID=1926495 RepID=UPI0039E461D0